MKNTFNSFIVTALLAVASSVSAQSFSVPLEGFSKKKTAYLHMENKTVHKGLLGGFKYSKGLIETVKMKNPEGGKIKVDPAKISYMYLAPSNLGKLVAFNEKIGHAGKWNKTTTLDTTLMDEGYVYFEKVNTKIKKKTNEVMLQLLNASFSSKYRVYHDPYAKETASIGVGGVTVAGGLDKSYYIKKVGSKDPGYRIMKKNYKEEFPKIFGDNKEFMAKWSGKAKWSDLETHLAEYSK